MPSGTRVYAVRGYPTNFRLAAIWKDRIFLYQAWRRSPKVQIAVDKLMLRPPVIGPLLQKAAIARWTRTLATTFAAGVPLVEALDSVGPAAGNAVYKEATRQIAAAFDWAGSPERFRSYAPAKPHCYDQDIQEEALAWFDKHLKAGTR